MSGTVSGSNGGNSRHNVTTLTADKLKQQAASLGADEYVQNADGATIFYKNGSVVGATNGYNGDGSIFGATSTDNNSARTGSGSGQGSSGTSDIGSMLSGGSASSGADFTSSWTSGNAGYSIDPGLFGSSSVGLFAGLMGSLSGFSGFMNMNWLSNLFNGFLSSLSFNFNTTTSGAHNNPQNESQNQYTSITNGSISGYTGTIPTGATQYKVENGVYTFYDANGNQIGEAAGYKADGTKVETAPAVVDNTPAGGGDTPPAARRPASRVPSGWQRAGSNSNLFGDDFKPVSRKKDRETAEWETTYRSASDVANYLISKLGVTGLNNTQIETFTKALISANPSVFSSDGSLKPGVTDWSKLDYPGSREAILAACGQSTAPAGGNDPAGQTTPPASSSQSQTQFDTELARLRAQNPNNTVVSNAGGNKVITSGGTTYTFDNQGRKIKENNNGGSVEYTYINNDDQPDNVKTFNRAGSGTVTETENYYSGRKGFDCSLKDFTNTLSSYRSIDAHTISYTKEEGGHTVTVTVKFSDDNNHIVSKTSEYTDRAAQKADEVTQMSRSNISTHWRM
ncbi:hypothetical protein IKE67_03925 [bacterium]|nr:hypothetical protein [bacterium]